jgi:hypothetical protein
LQVVDPEGFDVSASSIRVNEEELAMISHRPDVIHRPEADEPALALAAILLWSVIVALGFAWLV